MTAMTATPLAAAAIAQLEAEGVDTVIGTVVNPAGLTQAKTVPIRRTNTFANPGLGASPVWHTFCIDQCSIAFTADISVVGDQRLRIDLSALRIIGDGLAWAPAGFFEQDGTPVPACSRGTLSRIEAALADAGIDAVIGHEVEFLLVDADGQRLPSTLWAQYGVAGVLEHEAFVRDVNAAATAAGIAIEQFHPEYGANQFEISLAPQPPVAAADQLVLTRLIIGRTARRHGLRVEPIASALRRKYRIRCPPTLLADYVGRDAVLRWDWSSWHDLGRGGRGGRSASRTAGRPRHPVRIDRVRSANATR